MQNLILSCRNHYKCSLPVILLEYCFPYYYWCGGHHCFPTGFISDLIYDLQVFDFQELKAELKLCSHAATDDRDTLQTQLSSMISDLKTTKHALDETIKREKQVFYRAFLIFMNQLTFCQKFP